MYDPTKPEAPPPLSPFVRWLVAMRKRGYLGLMGLAALVLLLIGLYWYTTSRAPSSGQGSSPTPRPSATVQASSPSTTPAAYAMSVGPAPSVGLKVPAGYAVHVFASGAGTARDLQFSPGGTLLVSNPATGNVTALPDANRDGVADSAKTVLHDSAPNVHGLAFYGGKLFVAEESRVVRYNWSEATLTATQDKVLFSLPTPNADHNKRTIVFDAAGHMFVSVGSTCNVCIESDPRSATIMESDADGANPHVFATGLRNAPFIAINPSSNELWSTEMGRDYLGDNTPPDEINIIQAGQNYGWPICYGAKIHDTNFDHKTYIADPCVTTIAPIFGVPAHNAPLGLAFIKSAQFPLPSQGDLIVAYHGSWNRSVPDGYKLVHLTVRGNTIAASEDFMTGFINGSTAAARPVDVTFDTYGNLFVSDDKSGSIYIVQKQL